MLDIRILTIPHDKQRYITVGDWYYKGSTLYIYVSSLNDWRKEIPIAIHELTEAFLCYGRGISEKEVDKFDMLWDYDSLGKIFGEPGNDPSAPYHKEHIFSTSIEKLLVAELGLKWEEYEEALNSL